MRLAMTEAMKSDPDFYWWLNDDTLVEQDALARLLETSTSLADAGVATPIVVGSTRDPETGQVTYGGWARASWWHPLRFRLVEPTAAPARCDAMNGNCTLIPRSVVEKVGNLDPAFTHGRGDYDYALRAWASGCSVWVAAGYFGECSHNSPCGSWRDTNARLPDRLERVLHPKGLPPREWAIFSRRHAGPLWPLYWSGTYVKLVMGGLRRYHGPRR
jgi:GT2 family glycosyltransferase